MPLAPGTRLGAYEILGPLGAGGMGEVYRAVDTQLKREVAVKVLPPELAGDSERRIRFQREAEVLASLNHPNIAQIYGIEQNALVMELVDGETLRGPLPVDTVVDYARQIAEGLEASHEKGVVHRDLKPGNIMVTPAGVIKILDFGLAAVAPRPASSDPENSPTLTMGATVAGVIMGTAAYMSPEQAAGKQVDKRSDIWSYGVVLYELLTGKRLFEGESISHTLADVLRAPIALDAVPVKLRKLLGRCLDRNAKTRLQDIGEARIALGQLEEPEVVRPAATTKLPWMIAAGAVAAAVAFGVFALRQPSQEERLLRFQIAPPEGTHVQTFALSPDGKLLVLAARKSGKTQLWVRDMNSLSYQALSGTDDATYPFWSPDSRQIGFFADGKLRKIQASGGPAVALAEAIEGRGGTWNQHNEIVFAPSNIDKLYRIPAGGGQPVALASVSGTHNHRFPVFLPDGKRVLSNLRNKETDGIFVNYLDGSPPKRVLPDSSSAAWQPIPGNSGMGYLLFRRERTLMAQRFRESDLTPDGEAIPITNDIATSNVSRILATPGPSGMLIYQDGAEESKSTLTWFGRDGKRLGYLGQPGDRLSITLSPDGKTVAVEDVRDQQPSIRLIDAERGTETRLASASGTGAVWWPSGKAVLFRGPGGLASATLGGIGEPETILAAKTFPGPSDVSRDGRQLLYWERDPKLNSDLWILSDPGNRTGQNQPKAFLKTPFREIQAKFSPDTKWIAYTSDESGKDEVYVRSFPDGNQVKRASVDGGRRAIWREDGQELFYETPDSEVMAVGIRNVGGEIRLGAPEKLFRFTPRPEFSTMLSTGYNYAVTRDGKRFLVIESDQKNANPPLTVITNWMPTTKK